MFILSILVIMLIMLVAFIIIGLASAGASFIIIFGDVIVAIGVIGAIIWYLIKKRCK